MVHHFEAARRLCTARKFQGGGGRGRQVHQGEQLEVEGERGEGGGENIASAAAAYAPQLPQQPKSRDERRQEPNRGRQTRILLRSRISPWGIFICNLIIFWTTIIKYKMENNSCCSFRSTGLRDRPRYRRGRSATETGSLWCRVAVYTNGCTCTRSMRTAQHIRTFF